MSRIGARIILFVLLLSICVPLVLYFTDDSFQSSVSGDAQFSELTVPDEDPLVSDEEAIEIAMAMLPEATYYDLMEFSQRYEDAGWVYEGTIRGTEGIYSYRIDGDNGNLIEWEIQERFK